MKPILRKTLFMLSLYYLAILLQSCLIGCNCPGSKFPYFDYSAIAVSSNITEVVKPNENLIIKITPENTTFVADACIRSHRNWGIITAAFACDCVGDGHDGQKFKIQKINIYADSVYSDAIDPGKALNELFEFQFGYEGLTYFPLNDAIDQKLLRFDYQYSTISLRLKERPVSSRPYKFRLELFKENGEILLAETNQIEWE